MKKRSTSLAIADRLQRLKDCCERLGAVPLIAACGHIVDGEQAVCLLHFGDVDRVTLAALCRKMADEIEAKSGDS